MNVSILKTYLKRLTNLSNRNRSLLLGSLPSEQFLDIDELDFLDNFASFEIVRQLIAQKNVIKLCDTADPRMAKINEVSKKLRKIARTEQFIEAERGAEDLYVGWPFVRGKLMDETLIHGPLAFFPVTLEQTDKHWQLRRRDEPATLNRSFLLAYSHFNQVPLPDELLELNLSELDRDALNFRTQLYELLRDSPLKINFNQDIFQEKLQPFDVLKPADLALLEQNGELKLYSEAVLGIFPQAGSYLAPDYETLIERKKEKGEKEKEEEEGLKEKEERGKEKGEREKEKGEGLKEKGEELKEKEEGLKEKGEGLKEKGENEEEAGENLLVGISMATANRENSEFLIRNINSSSPVKEEHTFTAFAQDASQEEALRRVKAGESLVVQGPPGTGKSQLIANLLSDFAARGKRVLLVCQKRVALDVVHQRLQSVGMMPFLALIHDFKNDRGALYRQLAAQIEEVESYQKQNYSLDAIFLERKFLQSSRSIEQAMAELDEFKTALFDTSNCGLSAKELYLTSQPSAPQINLDGAFRMFRFDDKLEDFLRRIRQYEAYHNSLNAGHWWHDRVDFADFSLKNLSKITAILPEIPRWLTETGCELSILLKAAPQTAAVESWLGLLQNPTTWHLFKMQNEGFFDAQARSFFTKTTAQLHSLSQRGLLSDEFTTADLPPFSQRLQQLIEARSSWSRWIFYADKPYFKAVVARYGLTLEPTDLHKLNDLVANRLSWENELATLHERLGLTITGTSLAQLQQQLEALLVAHENTQKAHQQFKDEFSFLEQFMESDFFQFQNRVAGFLKTSQETAQKNQDWRLYLTPTQISQLIATPDAARHYADALRADFDLLVEADKLKNGFLDAEWAIVEQLFAIQNNFAQPLAVFQNSLRLAWLTHLETKNPILRAVSSLKISQLEETLQQEIVEKQNLSREILLLKLREQTYQDLAFNRLQNRVTYRELQHQVNKKRSVWPVRKLLENYADDVFKLVPCWLASPESVSAMFPLVAGLFDLVIFDEASQCYAEYGLPALFRGKQTVVAGDSKQLTPTDLYRVRYEVETDDETPALEVESLLDLATQYLPQTQLQGHYRSHSLDLIAFSNHYFYNNKLELLPHFEAINQVQPAIKYLKVAGIWQHNTNQVEAERVVALVQELQQQYPEKSIGIVTFNHPQQQLIEQLMYHTNLYSPVGGWGAKNIENVQGDERDIIVFSVGYAPDAQGKMRAQFGSLNAQGGENRLNVAVTRAREQVWVVTSIWPEQLLVENTAHEGPKLLKKYLEYALDVSEGRFKPEPRQTEGYRNDWFLKQKIREYDTDTYAPHAVEAELPFADLTVKDQNGQYQSLILTDDDRYFQAISAKEAHAYWPLQLRAKGWHFDQRWSREWWRKQ
ncbi:MAG: DUF4011 domain-containing protein [Runella slithyformis]|nr:MAG: DUF4011 domain-containing protein [Runella slithyformis]TAF28506.1 MAG: DUF4011 domain-containing protein [Runella slithyformis]TAF47185.1 MAG: DUF4011 domain-containing protein [Runella slithyformis]TAF82073.1 MAG: DUF4011 domain-containing protein [Runella slithyformis]